jgi:hypothetical protein
MFQSLLGGNTVVFDKYTAVYRNQQWEGRKRHVQVGCLDLVLFERRRNMLGKKPSAARTA